ncbi:hypothetical protein GCM10023322_50720 [Rugosimonospora acidiphila]|uniref:MmyB-like transcription regulator ligand binding domain-containing protein n=1 Tax=Rugosimonospora acidiphila TaxID=556531 RepID=A0ABP9S7G3_9ACTN
MSWLMDDALVVLGQEFEAREGSFQHWPRPELVWDRDAFTRLERAMRAVCERAQDDDTLERWMAEEFHYVPRFVRDWTTHPNFPRPGAAWRFALQVSTSADAGRVLVRPNDRGVHAHVPCDQPVGVRADLQPEHYRAPDSGSLPPPEQAVDRLPWPVQCGNVPPRRTDPDPPPNPVNQLSFRPLSRPA